ncbi:hypothetical protein CTAYLR_000661 [Chrysophaeum taylorii]|uniref:Chromatin assembly factor 1 subunit A dimerization domain-containing protein n=1 Tax=Chrysophaeum taylorii TaxID=2483200 RepID=A0AAD7U9H9_9STRA|nr:hypothetical protein CTAYLR_000661 [Chrysophaeum taylorii]
MARSKEKQYEAELAAVLRSVEIPHASEPDYRLDWEEVVEEGDDIEALVPRLARSVQGFRGTLAKATQAANLPIDESVVAAKIRLIAERKAYGVASRCVIQEDESPVAMWHWEVTSMERFSKKSATIIKEARAKRTKAGKKIKALKRVLDVLEKHPDDKARISREEEKVEKLKREEEAARLKEKPKPPKVTIQAFFKKQPRKVVEKVSPVISTLDLDRLPEPPEDSLAEFRVKRPKKRKGPSVFIVPEEPPAKKFFKFHENYRPAFYGVCEKTSDVVTGIAPFARDPQIDYDVDSDAEFAENDAAVEDAEEIGDEEDEEDDEDVLDYDDGFLAGDDEVDGAKIIGKPVDEASEDQEVIQIIAAGASPADTEHLAQYAARFLFEPRALASWNKPKKQPKNKKKKEEDSTESAAARKSTTPTDSQKLLTHFFTT